MHCFYFNKYWSISVYNFDSTVSHCVKFDKCNLEVLYICSLFTFNKYWSISVYNFDSTISHYVKFDRCNLKVLHSWRVYNFNKYWYWSISLYNFYSTISHYVKFDRCNLKVLHRCIVFTLTNTDQFLCIISTVQFLIALKLTDVISKFCTVSVFLLPTKQKIYGYVHGLPDYKTPYA
jgi:hypothetical protein